MKAFFAIVTIVLALTNPVVARESNYVVIGAFSIRDNAVRLAEKAKAEFDINPARQLFYVFVLKTEDRTSAFAEVTRLQKETSYTDAWVFSGTLGAHGSGKDLTIDPVVETPVPVAEIQPVIEAPSTQEEPQLKEEPKTDIALDPKAQTKDFYFNVMNIDGAKLDGAEITIVEPKSQRKEYVMKGNENVTMRAINQSGDIRLECDLVGYRKIIQTFNFKVPDSLDGLTIENNRIIVPFYLVRLQKGDHSILYNVFFYKDAAIMRPESRPELDGLLAMMNENVGYKIKIHGHTNGNAAGRILETGESGDPFSLSGAREGRGSAKKLSEKRAGVIRDYLVKNGIDAGRMTVKAWGGKKPIYDKNHTQASANVRVEVEVIEE
ncbi:MAG TPA: OmpA family protein [Cyclobacteriaceae bacterium]|nr:OmpA family protein [Cyclobacteriaceae bacterium]